MNCIICSRLNAFENEFYLIAERDGNARYAKKTANFCGNCLLKAFNEKKAFVVCTACKAVFVADREHFILTPDGADKKFTGEDLNALIVRLIEECEFCTGGHC